MNFGLSPKFFQENQVRKSQFEEKKFLNQEHFGHSTAEDVSFR